MKGEIVDLVDENDIVVGSTDVETAHELKQFHRVAGVFVFDENGDLLMQKENKYGRYDTSVGGHVGAGESYEDAVRREMEEELSLTVPVQKVSVFLSPQARLNHWWGLYEGKAPQGWEFKETDEVKSLERMPLPEIVGLMNESPDKFTPGFINTMREYVRVKGYPFTLP